MKQLLLIVLWVFYPLYGISQLRIFGHVASAEDSSALSGVNIISETGSLLSTTDSLGNFKITYYKGSKLIFSHMSFKPDTLSFAYSVNQLKVYLKPLRNELAGVVVSTGYQLLSDKKVTGSYTHLSEKMIQRSMGPDILGRLEGISNSLLFIRKDVVGERERAPELRIRGKSTIFGDGSPLIILDNFPFEGDMSDINPNDIESVTFLKDAAAASIWGARAGNGVIVIRTIRGKTRQGISVNFTSNFTLGARPDLFYSPTFINSADFIAVEEELHRRGFYVSNPTTLLSPVAEILLKNGSVPEELKQIDFRNEAQRLFYRKSFHQQYALNFRGGGEKYSFYLSGGYDNQQLVIRDNGSQRLSFQSNFDFKPLRNLSLDLGLNFTQTEGQSNGVGISEMTSPGKQALPPYTVFTHSDGSAASVGRSYSETYVAQSAAEGLLDWQYRPLEEPSLRKISNGHTANRINAGLVWTLVPKLKWEIRYQYHSILNKNSSHNFADSYYARDLVNKYTQANGSRIIPTGSILEGSGSQIRDHSGRMQLAYSGTVGNRQELDGILGAEIRQNLSEGIPGYMIFGMDDDILVGQTRFNYTMFYPLRPQGLATLPAPASSKRYLLDRFLSYYSNILYSVDKKYSLSLSARADGANLYGIKVNQKIVPLWSAGVGWIISREKFFNSPNINFLKARFSYGFSGNSLKSVTAFPTATYRNDSRTGLRSAILRSPGNPSLRWEKVETSNLGVDFSWLNGTIKGSAEYFIKRGLDLIGDDAIDPTTGLGFQPQQGVALTNRINYANTRTKGIDIEFYSRNTKGTWEWSSSLLLNYVTNWVTSYKGADNPNIFSYTGGVGAIPPVNGMPLDPMYSLPWYGLSPIDGSPLVMTPDGLNNNYSTFINSIGQQDLLLSGSTVPKLSGSLLNTIEKGNFALSFNLSWKLRYYFRAPGINYYNLFNSWGGHREIVDRWMKPGDENFTQIPSLPTRESYDASGRRDLIYTQSEIMVEKGDHIRWNDLNISYTFNKNPQLFSSLKLIFHAQNLGVLWRRNDKGIDPDYANAAYPPSRTYSFGINANF